MPELLPSFSWTDESTDEETVRPKTKEEDDVETLCSWMQVGGLPAQLEGEAQGLLLEVSLFPSLLLGFCVAFYLLFTFLPLVLFHLLGAGSTEKGGPPMQDEAQKVEDGGTAFGGLWAWRRWKWQWQAQRWRVFMGFWGEQCHIPPCPQSSPPHKKVCITPHLPPSPTCPL